MASFRKIRGEQDKTARQWLDFGRVDQEAVGEPTTNFETPGRELAQVARDGQELGSARVPADVAVGKASGAQQWIDGAEKARTAVVAERSLREKLPAAKQVATKKSRLANHAEKLAALVRQTDRLEQVELPRAEERVRDQKGAVDALRERYERLPRHLRGFIGAPAVLAFIELAVVIFDGGSLNTALTRAGYASTTVWFLSVAVPLLVLAVNHGLGIVAGAIGGTLKSNRQRVAVATFAAGFGALLTTFILVTVFRADATSAQNAALTEWAKGNLGATPSLLISPIWLGPAQIAGSIVSISCVALFTIAKPGRELHERLHEEQQTLAIREGDEAKVRGEIERSHREHDAELLVPAAIEAEVAEAQATLDAHPELHAQKLAAEKGLADAARGKLVAAFTYSDRIHANGRVWKVALPNVRFLGFFRFSQGPGDEVQPFPPSPPNGHHDMTPGELRPLINN